MCASPLWYGPFRQELAVRVKYLNSAVNGVGHINFVVASVDRYRSRIVELSFAIAFGAPGRQHLSIRAKLHDSSAPLIHDIDRFVCADGDSAWSVKTGRRAFPLTHDTAIWCQFLHHVLRGVGHVSIANGVDGDP